MRSRPLLFLDTVVLKASVDTRLILLPVPERPQWGEREIEIEVHRPVFINPNAKYLKQGHQERFDGRNPSIEGRPNRYAVWRSIVSTLSVGGPSCDYQPLTVLMAVLLAAFATTACEQLVAPERIEALKKDVEAVAVQIKAAEVEDAQYSGGLIKALV